MSYLAIVVNENDEMVMSQGHYDMEKLKEIMKGHLESRPNCKVLYEDEALEFSWLKKYERLSGPSKWMIETAIPELKTTGERMQHSVDKLLIVAQIRIKKAGFTTVCGRCGGTGKYSYNRMDGTVCYGCRGEKIQMIKLTKSNKNKIAEHFQTA